MRRKKEDFIVIVLAGILLIILIGIILLSFRASKITPGSSETSSPQPSRETNAGIPPVAYNGDDTDRLIKKVQNRVPLSVSDVQAKDKILNLVPENHTSGYVYQSDTVNIEYLSSPDVLMVEILTTNLDKAKNDANKWLRDQGLSQEGICNFPVSFYINWDIAQKLRNKNIIFSPLPNSC